MPTGTPFNSFVAPYRIRVDDFASSNLREAPLLHLLTHTHSDHINGLSAKSFGYKVYCSQDAKAMVLKHEVYAEREFHTKELRAEKIRTYSHLKIDPLQDTDGRMYYTGSRDLLHPLPLNTPTKIALDGSDSVTLTLLDANHCPGAVMFLIEGKRGAVLHTGDFRGEPWFLESLTRNPFLHKYISPEGGVSPTDTVSQTLETIYLDTACALSTLKPPTKNSATAGLVRLMKLLPESTYFFFNCWTWGYEDILKAVATSFQSKIHVDRYKHSIYSSISDVFLAHITTLDPTSTRFHACERFNRCSLVAVEDDFDYSNSTSIAGKRVVYVNPVNMDDNTWQEYLEVTKAQLLSGQEINNLLVPLYRHSTLPELKEFVTLFRPKRVVPNTLDPRLKHLDWACLNKMFAPCLHASMQTTSANLDPSLRMEILYGENSLNGERDVDVVLENLIGNGATEAAERWADQGKLLKKTAILREYLDEDGNDLLDTILGVKRPKIQQFEGRLLDYSYIPMFQKQKRKAADSDAEEDNDEDSNCDSEEEHARTAHYFFANSDDKENMWWPSSDASQRDDPTSVEPASMIITVKPRAIPGGNGSWRVNRMTPEPSPVHHRRQRIAKLDVTENSNAADSSYSRADKKSSPATPMRRVPQLGRRGSASPIYIVSSPPCMPPVQHVAVDTPSMPLPQLSLDPLKTAPHLLIHEKEIVKVSSMLSTGKRARSDDPTAPLGSSKKPCHEPPSAVIPDSALPSSESYITFPYVPTLHEMRRLKRMETADQLALQFPEKVAPTYTEKRESLISYYKRKERDIIADCATLRGGEIVTQSGSRRPLVHAKTVLSFERINEEGEEFNWNRSRILADTIRNDMKNGRKYSLPTLKCLQSS